MRELLSDLFTKWVIVFFFLVIYFPYWLELPPEIT